MIKFEHEAVVNTSIPFGDICRVNGAPGRSVGRGLALWVSAQDNDFGVGTARAAIGGEGHFPLPTDRECQVAASVAGYVSRLRVER